jgi:hypothetical protein
VIAGACASPISSLIALIGIALYFGYVVPRAASMGICRAIFGMTLPP